MKKKRVVRVTATKEKRCSASTAQGTTINDCDLCGEPVEFCKCNESDFWY